MQKEKQNAEMQQMSDLLEQTLKQNPQSNQREEDQNLPLIDAQGIPKQKIQTPPAKV